MYPNKNFTINSVKYNIDNQLKFQTFTITSSFNYDILSLKKYNMLISKMF